MKQSEKQRLTSRTRDAVAQITDCPQKLKEYAEKIAANFSPTNAQQFRALSHIVWWLIAAECEQGAVRILDALCEVEDNFYWMFHALGSTFATRAWLHAKQKKIAAARNDARTALQWIHRDPNAKAMSESEVQGSLKLFDGWLARAASEKGTVMVLRVMSHAMQVLVMYQQFSKAGDSASKSVPEREYTTRIDLGIAELSRRIENF